MGQVDQRTQHQSEVRSLAFGPATVHPRHTFAGIESVAAVGLSTAADITLEWMPAAPRIPDGGGRGTAHPCFPVSLGASGSSNCP